MPRKAQFPPKVENLRGYARVRVNGEYVYLGKAGSPEADQAYKELLAKILGEKANPQSTGPSVKKVCDLYLAHIDKELTGKARQCLYRFTNAVRVVSRTVGNLPAADLRVRHLKQVQEAMASGSWMTDEERTEWKKHRRPIGWSGKVVNRQIGRIKQIWRWAEEEELVPPGSLAHLRTVKPMTPRTPGYRKTDPTEPTDYEDLMRVVKFCPLAVAVMLQVQWWAGMRSGEIRIMRTCDLDRSGEVWTYTPAEHKNDWRGQERTIALGPKCQALLDGWLKPDKPDEYLFVTSEKTKAPYTESSYPQAVRRACARAGISIIPYGGRHACKERISREFGIEAARQILGQKSIEATNQYSQRIDLKHAADVAKKAC